MKDPEFYERLESYCRSLEGEFELIPSERKGDLELLGKYIASKLAGDETPRLTVICTHNSRRSHFGQVWLAVAAAFYGLKLETYSGGTEATAFHPNAVAALQRTGLEISQVEGGNNPVYEMKFGPEAKPWKLFSKKFDDAFNPKHGFAAIMVCSEADEGCPFVPGAGARFSLPYLDPKQADGTVREMEIYDERCRQLAREMFFATKFAMQKIKNGMPNG